MLRIRVLSVDEVSSKGLSYTSVLETAVCACTAVVVDKLYLQMSQGCAIFYLHRARTPCVSVAHGWSIVSSLGAPISPGSPVSRHNLISTLLRQSEDRQFKLVALRVCKVVHGLPAIDYASGIRVLKTLMVSCTAVSIRIDTSLEGLQTLRLIPSSGFTAFELALVN